MTTKAGSKMILVALSSSIQYYGYITIGSPGGTLNQDPVCRPFTPSKIKNRIVLSKRVDYCTLVHLYPPCTCPPYIASYMPQKTLNHNVIIIIKLLLQGFTILDWNIYVTAFKLQFYRILLWGIALPMANGSSCCVFARFLLPPFWIVIATLSALQDNITNRHHLS